MSIGWKKKVGDERSRKKNRLYIYTDKLLRSRSKIDEKKKKKCIFKYIIVNIWKKTFATRKVGEKQVEYIMRIVYLTMLTLRDAYAAGIVYVYSETRYENTKCYITIRILKLSGIVELF